MSYNPVNWVNGETPINDVNLNNMDQGISAAHKILADHDKKIDDFANQQLPEEYVKSAVDEYVNENSGGFATATALAETKESLESKTNQLSSEIANVESEIFTIKNVSDTENLNSGFMYNGVPQDNAQWSYTDYIPCKYGDTIWCALVWGNLPCLNFFDENKEFLYQVTLSGETPSEFISGEYTIEGKTVAYVVHNVNPHVTLPYMKIKKPTTPPYKNNVFNVGKDNIAEYDFRTLKACTEYIRNHDIINTTVYVHGGEYDLFEEFGSDYFNSLPTEGNADVGEMYGLYVGNNTHFIFNNHAKITFNYDGSNWATSYRFAPLNIYGSVTLENCIIECTNCRYCVHEDLAVLGTTMENSKGYIVKYLNCYFKHNGNPVQGYLTPLCIGAGTHRLSYTLVEGGRFECNSNPNYPYTILYHNTRTTEESQVTIKDIYSNKGIWFNTSVADKNTVHCEICNCKIVGGINKVGSAFDLIEWNNVVS